ncbi:protein GVQW3-like [Scylla paramamosain]|uniref:protein GVQW3-like n=1 Tax=Scylla paramamosain TaxID=85552 RepID=UPI003083C2DB
MEPVECRAVIRDLRGRTPRETFDEMKDTYGEGAPSYDVVKHWHHQFMCGWTSVETAPIPGRPQSAINEDTIRQVEAAILEDRRITVHQLAQDVKINVGSVDKILHDHLYLWKLSVR